MPDAEQLKYGTPLTIAEDALMAARDQAAEKLGTLRAYGAAHPDDFGGLWISYPTGATLANLFTINVAFVGHVADHSAAVARITPANANLNVAEVANPLAEMSALHERIGKDQAFLGSIGTTLNSIETDIPNNQVVVSVSTSDASIDASIIERYGPAVHVIEGSQVQPDVCTRLDCGPPWKGGIKIARTNPTGYCTSGYVVRKLVGATYNYAIWTAGHCTSGTWREGSISGTTIGTTSAVYFSDGGNTDIQVIPISASQKSNQIIDDTASCTNCTLRVMTNGQQGLNEDNVGDTVCNEGAFTGRTCGVIKSTDYTFNWTAQGKILYHFARATYVRIGGDSGGPVWTTVGSKAAGSHTHYVTINNIEYPVYPHVYWMTQYSAYSVNPT
ncbi:MAG TPA: hypothetical protein VM427_11195 [Patescibacteria group bacterium]|nr:hypothetical protein [Patescibacteria group bacterium]